MPRGRKRKIAVFVPQPWIPNTSSEDEHDHDHRVDDHDHRVDDQQGADVPDQVMDGKSYLKIHDLIK